VEENKEPTTSSDDVEAHTLLERAPVDAPVDDLQKDDGPDVEGHALLERSPVDGPVDSPVERAPVDRPMD
jgi:hypothetical protein